MTSIVQLTRLDISKTVPIKQLTEFDINQISSSVIDKILGIIEYQVNKYYIGDKIPPFLVNVSNKSKIYCESTNGHYSLSCTLFDRRFQTKYLEFGMLHPFIQLQKKFYSNQLNGANNRKLYVVSEYATNDVFLTFRVYGDNNVHLINSTNFLGFPFCDLRYENGMVITGSETIWKSKIDKIKNKISDEFIPIDQSDVFDESQNGRKRRYFESSFESNNDHNDYNDNYDLRHDLAFGVETKRDNDSMRTRFESMESELKKSRFLETQCEELQKINKINTEQIQYLNETNIKLQNDTSEFRRNIDLLIDENDKLKSEIKRLQDLHEKVKEIFGQI